MSLVPSSTQQKVPGGKRFCAISILSQVLASLLPQCGGVPPPPLWAEGSARLAPVLASPAELPASGKGKPQTIMMSAGGPNSGRGDPDLLQRKRDSPRASRPLRGRRPPRSLGERREPPGTRRSALSFLRQRLVPRLQPARRRRGRRRFLSSPAHPSNVVPPRRRRG